ncbi:MAG: MMPL family transporter [Acidobacteria bacterium]|nr:MMPL family transporter [Acidobacteriota bacterium]
MRRRFSLVAFSVKHPRLVIVLAGIVTLAFATQFAKLKTDTNPKNMLPETSDVRVWNDQIEQIFGLYEDMIVIGVSNEAGVLNPRTLEKIKRITDELMQIKGIAGRDVSSFPTITNVTAEAGFLKVAPLMTDIPSSSGDLEALRTVLFDNPLFVDRIISRDGKVAAIYVPLEKGANGKEIADTIRRIVARVGGPEQYYVAGDPVARDTFGAEMFKIMGIFSPIAGMIMFLAIYLMFRNIPLALSMMAVAMISIVWSMGLVLGLGFPIHIMSSMSPVFLMAIATDSIHIFNEFYFRYRECRDRRAAILDTMEAVGRPVRYTALATASGFAVLLFMHIIPVQVFGGLVAFGTLALRLLSFSFIPAILMLVNEERISRASAREDAATGPMGILLRKLGSFGAFRPGLTVAGGLLVLLAGAAGATLIRINNNMVSWFKEGSAVRVADTVMNRALGGTSLAYVIADAGSGDEPIKDPAVLRTIEGLQRRLEGLPVVGKTTSVVDIVKRINRALHDDDPKFSIIPDSKTAVGQYLFLFAMSAKPSDLDNVINHDFTKANIWVQLKTWDAQAMRDVIMAIGDYKLQQRTSLDIRPGGVAYFNLVWNDEVLGDMVRGFAISLLVVFAILALSFRSLKWALVGYMPLLFTIAIIYGVVGLVGKDFDMPISVLSCLSLGMAVDFAIHFIGRFRRRWEERPKGGAQPGGGELADALLWTCTRPGKGILRNAVLFASAFGVMLFAPLTPYVTVGAFIVSMMTLSALTTILFVPALIRLLQGWLLKTARDAGK